MKCSVCHVNKAETSEQFVHSEMCLECIVDMCAEKTLQENLDNFGAPEVIIFTDEEAFERFASAEAKRTKN